MPQSKFTESMLVIRKGGIYKIAKISVNSDSNVYSLELLAYLQSSTDNIDTSIPKKIDAQESELEKFEYAAPRYPIGTKLSGGDEVYLVFFKRNIHQYRYNLASNNSITANLPEEDLTWR